MISSTIDPGPALSPHVVRCLLYASRGGAVTLPRDVIPGRFYMVTRRCTQRMFLLRPDEETNNAFLYCLAEAAQRFDMEILLTCAMSNHYHAVIFDREGTVPAFTQHFHKLLAKCQNAWRGRWENMWSSEQVCMVHLVDPADVMHKLVYVATNPVKDRLVEKVHHWPGVNGLAALLGGRALHATRPRHFFRARGPMPAAVTLHLALPSELGDPQDLLVQLRERVAAAEAAEAAERMRTGARVLGRRAILRQSWRDSPKSLEPRRNLRPRFAARNLWSRLEALRRHREFQVAYREAWSRWTEGEVVLFPIGTYWLRRFVHVPLVP
jgi:putative transposase